MENRQIDITAKNNSNVRLGLIPGHFATNHSHVNYFVDMTTTKTEYRAAREAARELAKFYAHNKQIDTILCFEGTEMIGAFLARDLCENGGGMNGGTDISVITPETNMNNQMIFRDNLQKKIYGKEILLLMSSISTGKSINRCVECLQYYSGKLAGVAAIFSAVPEYNGIKIDSVFSLEDMPEYKSAIPSECPLCASGAKVDAIVNSFGYSKI
ncbi:MAG: orotate phosphoribosyltransferase [Oscillospiraceae bacterium]|nr:orotate phosphoribosyltransferase [Oscillospiraceae bacterium]MBR1459746.1 orotate phosphoribosyltransferase [Oscillospiraceae bacterium]MBR1897991.1 orotate phosphoribosyltransferase [Oscillospiraceae bacterium]